MAHTKVTKTYSQNTGVANTFSYSGSFDVFKGTEVVALLDNVALTYTATTINESASPREYTVDTAAKTIHIGGADLSSGTIIIRPETDLGSPTPRAEYTPGASITSADLNNNQKQLLRRAMEYEETVLFNTGGVMTGDLGIGEDQTIYFEGATDNAYETTLTVVDPTADRTITLPNVTGTVVTTGDTATVTATMMAANSVDSSELVDGSVDNSHLADDAVNSDELASGAVDLDHMSVNSVGEHQYIDDSIKSAHISNDQIDSQHYAAGSIDLEHMSSASVDSDNIVDDTIVNADINSSAGILFTKLENLDNTRILVGNGSNKAAEVAVSGDVTITNTGVINLANGAVDHAHLAADIIDGDNIQDDVIDSEHYVAGSIDLEHMSANSVDSDQYVDGSIDLVHMSANSVDSDQYVDGSIDNEHLADDAVGADELAANAVVNASVASGAAIDHAKLAAVSSGNVLVGNGSNQAASVAMSGDVAIAAGGATTIQANAVEIGMIGCEQTTISDSDSHIPTSGAVVDYVAAVVGPIGGLEVIADDESFPNTIPAAGVVISITDCAGLSVNSSGVSTNGDALDNSTITINGFPSELRGGVGGNADPYVFASGAGLMVVSTGSSHTYNYHQALIREADFVQLSDDINDFNSRYRIGTRTANNSNTNDDGDLFFDTGTNKMYVYDGAYDSGGEWKEVTSAGDYKLLGIKDNGQAHNGTGPTINASNDQYDLFDGTSDASITSAGQLLVSLNGVIQKPNASYDASGEGFALDGADGIRFCDPPPSGSVLFVTQIGTATTLSVPADDSVTSAKIQDGAVDTDQLAADAVEGSKIADDAVGAEHIENLDGNVKWVDGAKALLGTDGDYEIWADTATPPDFHLDQTADGQTTYISAKQNGNIIFWANDTGNQKAAEFKWSNAATPVSSVELYNAGVKTASTVPNGFRIDGGEGEYAYLYMYSDEGDDDADKWRVEVGNGGAYILSNYAGGGWETSIECNGNGNVELYYDNAKKAETVSGGFTVTGVCTATSFAGDGSNLTGISGGVTSDANDNTLGGTNAGADITSGQGLRNTFFGSNSGRYTTTGDDNIAMGASAFIGSNSTAQTGNKNIAIGSYALDANLSGDSNTAVGYAALTSSTSASGNVAIGHEALTSCTTQGYTTAVGYRALATMQTGATSNVAVGYKAMEDVTVADDGVAVGYGALQNLTEGVKNVAVGAECLATVTTGQKNTGMGYLALYKTTNSDNTAVGYMALYNDEGGNKNTAVGAEALNSQVSGVEATAIGYQAGNSYTANGGVFVGRQAGKTNATSQDTVLYIARNTDSAGNNGTWIYGNDVGQCINGDNSTAWATTSDGRLKKDIVDNNVGLAVINNVRVRNFKYKQYNKDSEGAVTTPKTFDDTIDVSSFNSGATAHNLVIGQGKTGTQLGVIAQELETVAPNCVRTDDWGAKTVQSDELMWNMINAIKELSTKNDALEARIAALEAG